MSAAQVGQPGISLCTRTRTTHTRGCRSPVAAVDMRAASSSPNPNPNSNPSPSPSPSPSRAPAPAAPAAPAQWSTNCTALGTVQGVSQNPPLHGSQCRARGRANTAPSAVQGSARANRGTCSFRRAADVRRPGSQAALPDSLSNEAMPGGRVGMATCSCAGNVQLTRRSAIVPTAALHAPLRPATCDFARERADSTRRSASAQ